LSVDILTSCCQKWTFALCNLNNIKCISSTIDLNTSLICDKTRWTVIPPLFGNEEVGILRVKKRFPLYGVPIWSLWPNIRFLPSIVAEKNATKHGHIQNVCSMCIKINKVGKQKVGIWWVQKRFPRNGVPIWSLWPNIRSLPSIVAENNLTKTVHICSMCIKTN
jgi:hypothetical protein